MILFGSFAMRSSILRPVPHYTGSKGSRECRQGRDDEHMVRKTILGSSSSLPVVESGTNAEAL